MSILLVVVMSCIAAAGYFFGRDIPLADVWTYFEALRTTGAIVFGVMGALLAIVYPEVIKRGFRPEESGPGRELTNLTYITNPLAHSAILLILVVILGPVFAWVKIHFPDSTADPAIVPRGCIFALLAVLSSWQVLILLLVLRPLDLLHSHSAISKEKADMRRRIHTNGTDKT
jgi:hypothetical protein